MIAAHEFHDFPRRRCDVIFQRRAGALDIAVHCGFDQIPDCFPGRVVKVAPDGTRTHVNVPFPAGIVTHLGRVYVNAFSVDPATGFGGNPAWSGQLWQIFL